MVREDRRILHAYAVIASTTREDKTLKKQSQTRLPWDEGSRMRVT